jgi:hypothetical protein
VTFPTDTTGSANSGANTGSYVASLPDNLAVGDIVILSVHKDGTGAQTWPASPAWTNLGAAVSSGATIGWTRFRRIDGTEGWGGTGNSITITGASEGWAHAWAKVTGAHPTTDPISAGGASGNTNAPNPFRQPTAGDLSWGTEDTLWVVAYGWDGNVSHTSYPANYNDSQTTSRWANSNGCGVAMATRELAAPNEDPGTATISAAEQWTAWTIAVRPAPPVTNVDLGLVTETETSQVATLRENVVLGLTTETETAQPITVEQGSPITVNLGLVAETEASQPVALRESVVLGLTAETEAAQAATVRESVTFGLVAETETAQPVTVQQGGAAQEIALGLVTEAETGLPTSIRETLTLGLPGETETGLAVSTHESVVLGLVTETETAQAVTLTLSGPIAVPLGLITETETALPVTTGTVTYTFVPPSEERHHPRYVNHAFLDKFTTYQQGRSVKLNASTGLYETSRYWVVDTEDGVEGVDYFVGGHVYDNVPSAVASVLVASGYSPTPN